MWFWIVPIVLIVVFIVMEEFIYNVWNRYVFGAKEKKFWLIKGILRLKPIFAKRERKVDQTDIEESSPGN